MTKGSIKKESKSTTTKRVKQITKRKRNGRGGGAKSLITVNCHARCANDPSYGVPGVEVWLYPRGDGDTVHGTTNAYGDVSFSNIDNTDRWDIEYFASTCHGPKSYLKKLLNNNPEENTGLLPHTAAHP